MLSEKTNAHSDTIRSVAFSPDGTKIVSGSYDKTIKVWDSGALCEPKIAPPWPKLTPVGLSGRQAGDAEREDERPQRLRHVGGVFPGRDQDCVRIVRQDDQSLGFGCAGALKSPLLSQNWRLSACLADKLELLSEKTNAHSREIMSVAFSPDGTKIVSGSYDGTIKVWDMVKWSRKDHLMFNDATQQFVLLLLWLNKYSMKFPDDVLDLLIEACLQSKWEVRVRSGWWRLDVSHPIWSTRRAQCLESQLAYIDRRMYEGEVAIGTSARGFTANV
jgi:WD40 repeat protein